MIVVIAVVALVAVGLAAALAFGGVSRMSVHAPQPVSSVGGYPLPAGEFTGDDVADLRFDVALRGYRMEQVDDAIDRLRARIHDLEDQLDGHGRAMPGRHGADPASIALFPPVGGAGTSDDAPGPTRPAGHGDQPLS